MHDGFMKRFILALDGMGRGEALDYAKRYGSMVWGVKLEGLIHKHGYGIIPEFARYCKVMADVKLHVCPEQAEESVALIQARGADIITLHAAGGSRMLEAAAAALTNRGNGERSRALLAAVTVPLWLKPDEVKESYGDDAKKKVCQFARVARQAGVGAVVLAGTELGMLRYDEKVNNLGPLVKILVGIRPPWHLFGDNDDQARIIAPAEIGYDEHTYFVLGRAVRRDTEAALRLISRELECTGSA